jgi:hypothetical protein
MKKGYNYLANTNNRINNTNSTFTVNRFKPSNHSPLAYEKKAVKPFSSFAKTLNKISDSKEESNNNREKPNVRKVLSLSRDTNITIPTVQNNNLYIIRLRGQKSSFSGAPNIEISMSKSNQGKHNHNYIDGNGDPKILRKSVENIKNKVKKSKSTILDHFAIKGNRNKGTRKRVFFSGKFAGGETKYTNSNNNPIILTNVKGYNKSNKTMVFGKHPLHKKVSGKFKTVNKVRVFTPTSYTMNNIRY